MRRVFWLALGATVGVLVVRRVGRVANAWTPAGLTERAGGLGQRVSGFFDEVAAAAAEREAELRSALGVDGRPDEVA
ncbi:MAG TPA: DUF6167 family protein [Mycobacteriales bacterium]|nr:DUF6167 family protein [Mycobacteriales bacterium]